MSPRRKDDIDPALLPGFVKGGSDKKPKKKRVARDAPRQQVLKPREPAARLPASEKKKHHRSRRWDAQHQREVVSYRSIPLELQQAVDKVARDTLHVGTGAPVRVPTGEVARAFLEYSLQAFREGQFKLKPKLYRGRYHIYKPEQQDEE